MIDVVVLFFLLGLLARLVKSDLALPGVLYETLSIYLLLAIGLKGGVELSKQSIDTVVPQMLFCLVIGLLIPIVLYPVLRRLVGLNGFDAASVAAHYGSVSVVTFAVASAYLTHRNIKFEAHAALWVALLEEPGIVAGIALARWYEKKQSTGTLDQGAKTGSAWGALAHDVFLGKSVFLLVGGLTIGTVMGEAGTASIAPLFTVLFKGVLALFLLELGLVAGGRLGELKRYGFKLVAFALIAPVLLGMTGALGGKALGLSTGGIAIMATLVASASYIAAPTAMRIAVPQANAALSITAALGVSFPFNVLLGIPLYLMMAQYLS